MPRMRRRLQRSPEPVNKVIATFYRFVPLTALAELQRELMLEGEAAGLEGTILLAEEGINATIAGLPEELEAFLVALQARAPFADLMIKRSEMTARDQAFLRFKVKVKPEIVTLGQGALPVAATPAQHADVEQWHQLLEDPGVRVIDVRNRYEIEVGTFAAAEDPGTDSFREFPAYVANELDPERDTRLAIFCTGGIRCEKAAAYLAQQGFDDVVQLDGGILNYLAAVSPEDNRWEGECFVFDQRVTVDDALSPGGHEQCHACRRPVSETDRQSPAYVVGVSCPRCIDEKASGDRARFAERARQVALAMERGAAHLGPKAQQPPADRDADDAVDIS